MDVFGAEAGRKKTHTFRGVEEKRRIVAERLKAGVSVSSVARAHGINANQVFQWRNLYQQNLLDVSSCRDRMRLLPVAVSEEAESGTVVTLGATTIQEPAIAGFSTGTIELSLGWASCGSRAGWMGRTLRTVLGCLRKLSEQRTESLPVPNILKLAACYFSLQPTTDLFLPTFHTNSATAQPAYR